MDRNALKGHKMTTIDRIMIIFLTFIIGILIYKVEMMEQRQEMIFELME